MVRNDFVRAVHVALLARVGVDATIEFWSRHALHHEGEALSARALADHLWQESLTSPVEWSMRVANGLEQFLFEREITLEDFLETTRQFANRGSFVRARHLLTWLGPILAPLFRFGDPYRLLAHGTRLVSCKMSPGVIAKIVPWQAAAHGKPLLSSSLWLTYPGLSDGQIPAWDFPMQTGQHILAAPRIFGLPPYHSLVSVCDARSIESIPWNVTCRRQGDRFTLDGVTHGYFTPLGVFLAQAGYDPARLNLDSATEHRVAVVDCDYTCPVRRRVVLSAGCAYGSPGYLVRLGWTKARVSVRDLLTALHAEIGSDSDATSGSIEELHVRYLDSVSDVLNVVYFSADDSICLGAQHICRGTAARILRECVRMAVSEGRRDFTFREFKRLPTLVSHPKNTGFETRLTRLREALLAAESPIRIELSGRGRFTLVTKARLQLREVEEDRTLQDRASNA